MKQVLFDVSWLAHRARYTMRGLEHGGEPTGVIFGFFNELLSVCQDKRVLSNECHLFFDSRKSFRKQDFPFYKAKRAANRTPEEWADIATMAVQVNQLRKEILPAIGFPCYLQTGLESDDLIAMTINNYGTIGGDGYESVIVTNDSDLYQCIRHNAFWFDSARDVFLDEAALIHLKKVGPHDWLNVKCLMGCKTDNVPGVPGVGEKTAVGAIWGTLHPTSKKYIALFSKAGKQVQLRNRKLIKLPHARTKRFTLKPVTYNPGAFFAAAERLGFTSFLTGPRRYAWDAFFRGDLVGQRQIPRKRVV